MSGPAAEQEPTPSGGERGISRRHLVVGGAAAGGGLLGAGLIAALGSGSGSGSGSASASRSGSGERLVPSATIPGPGIFPAIGQGIDPTGSADSTSALQSLLDQAQQSGATVALPAGTFRVTKLQTAESFTQPSIVGAGMRATLLQGTEKGPVLAMTGGSGQLAGARISDLTVTGPSATGVELRGVGGVTLERVRFDGLAVGLLFHNAAGGSFTEFAVAESCVFDSSVDVPIEYRRGAGKDSFHGTGFRDCVLVQSDKASMPLVRIGTGCLVYNAPWEGTFFASSATPLVRNDSQRPVTSFGALRFEATPGTTGCQVVDPGSAAPVYHAGEAMFLGGGIDFGRLVLAEQVQINTDGSMNVARKPFVREVTLGGGTTSLVSFGGEEGGLVGISLSGQNYAFTQAVFVFWHAIGGGVVAPLGGATSVDGAGWGQPTFALDGRRLTITNDKFPRDAVRARVWVTPVGSIVTRI
jgi:hypothetical protein